MRVQEARDSLRQLKQAAGGAGDVQHFPMLHFDSAPTVEYDAVTHATIDIAESDTSENGMPFPKQFPDTEPPFAKSFMDNMSVSLGFHDDSEVSMHSFATGTSLISPANDFFVDVIDLESDSESDIEDEDDHIRYDRLPPAPRVGGVRMHRSGLTDCLSAAAVPTLFVCLSMCLIGASAGSALCCGIATPSVVSADSFWHFDTMPYSTLDSISHDNFGLDSGYLDSDNLGTLNLDSDYFDFSNLEFEVQDNN
ncbi:hypothetical protein CYMTET_41918 [Cymbomonas tetramitiformis]|uniref:Uncharacterized protein n=1 Tax=Cymbomonas tetramitiformis TaxID=36881 RepID=A0AAE0C584_9CHLO|nr:hypothetical protein CYMTET_41918 [Cymbomonas tetramitiformis]